MNHTKLVDFFKPMRIDRAYLRDEYIDKALHFIEPIHKRDDFKALLKDFNKSINIVLPNTKAMRFQNDFKLFNEIKLRARNAFPEDDGLKISKDESLMLQEMIDEHLKAGGVKNLLAEPISIIDKDKFKEEIMNASPATKELKMRNNLKHTIKVGIDKNPDFYKPLAQRLDELLKQKTEERITQLDLLKAFAEIQDEIIAQQKEGEQKGFITERERAVYDSMKTMFAEDAENATKRLFDSIKGELNIVGWDTKGRVQKDIENKVMHFLKETLDRDEAKAKAKEMVNVLIKNKNV
jgi:type I restriction enzyme R subunit